MITAAERVKMRRRWANTTKKGGAAARVPDFDEDSESDGKKQIELKTVAVGARSTGTSTTGSKARKLATASKANAVPPRVAEFDEDRDSDKHRNHWLNQIDETHEKGKQPVERSSTIKKQLVIHNSSSLSQVKVDAGKKSSRSEQQKQFQPEPNHKGSNTWKAALEADSHTATRWTSNPQIIVGPFLGKGCDPSALVGLHIEKTNVRGYSLEISPTLKLVEVAKEVRFVIDCERHDIRYHGFEMDQNLADALKVITKEKPVKIVEAVTGACWRFVSNPVRKGYGEHKYNMVGLRLEGMEGIGWIWGRESKSSGTIFSYCDVITVAPRC